jgi:hypothetical protein
MLGRYAFSLPDRIGELRPLGNTSQLDEAA